MCPLSPITRSFYVLRKGMHNKVEEFSLRFPPAWAHNLFQILVKNTSQLC